MFIVFLHSLHAYLHISVMPLANILLGSCTASPESLEALRVLRHYPFPTSCDAVMSLPDMESLEALRV